MNIKKIISLFLILIIVGAFPVFSGGVSTYDILVSQNDEFLTRFFDYGIEEEDVKRFIDDFDKEAGTLQVPEFRKEIETYFLSILFNIVLEKEEFSDICVAFDTIFQNEFLYMIENNMALPPLFEAFFLSSMGHLIREEVYSPPPEEEEQSFFNEDTQNEKEILEPEVEEMFTDLEGFEWAKEYIEELSIKKIIDGYGDKTFKPQNFITRAEAIKIISTTFLKTGYVVLESEFEDIKKDDWYYKYVVNAEYYSLFAKMYPNKLEADKYITRQEFCGIAYRAYMKKGKKLKEKVNGVTFYDSDNIKNFAYEAVTQMQRAGIISGMPNGFFLPDNNITRAEASKIVYLLCNN